MTPPTAPPPSDARTAPDLLDAAAARAIDLLDGERIARVWRTRLGFVLLTNLRVISVWHRPKLFGIAASEWHEGPDFFLFDLAPPRVVAGRFLGLSVANDESAVPTRFQVQEPHAIADAIAQAIPAGQLEWAARRARVQARVQSLDAPLASSLPPWPVREIVRVVVRVPCHYCGSLMDQAAPRCPTCGAAQH